MKLELVTWRDTWFEKDDSGPRKDCLVKTVGWTKREGRWLRIEGEHTPFERRSITRVPIENVVKRKKLK